MAPAKRPAVRYLQANAGTETPSHLVFFDTETAWKKRPRHPTQEDHRFRLGVAKYVRLVKGKATREVTLHFDSPDQWWEWLESLQAPRQVIWVFAHNIAVDLQWTLFWQRFQDGDYTSGPLPPTDGDARVRGKRPWRGRMVWGSTPVFLYLMGKHGRVNFVDSHNYWRTSLDKAGREINTGKLPMPDPAAPDADWYEYCERDVDVLRDLVIGALNHWRRLDAGVWQPTAPALALQSFRHMELADKPGRKAKRILLADRPEDAQLERDSYYGGYFGAFYAGPVFRADDPAPFTVDQVTGDVIRRPTGPVYQIDCNGLYPYVMSRFKYPCRRGARRDGIAPKDLLRAMRADSATARVRINTLAAEYPVRVQDHLIYLVGDYWTTLCGAELLRALTLDHVADVSDCCLYSTSKLFDRWVKFWRAERTAARREGDVHREGLAKLITNSLYGKFAQRGGGWQNTDEFWSEGEWTQWVHLVGSGQDDPVTGQPLFTQHHLRDLGGQVQERVEGEDPAHAFPAISAHVAAAAREYMRDIRHLLPEKSCYYQGTDSLLISHEAMLVLDKAGLLHEEEMGHFKIEGIYPDASIVAANHYRVGDKPVRSGTYGRAKLGLDGKWRAKIWEGATAFTSRAPDGIVTVTEIELKKSDPYPKGDEGADGWVQWAVHDAFFRRMEDHGKSG